MEHSRKILTLFVVMALVFTFVGGLSAQETGKININKASLEDLAQLKRIGPKYAERIIEYREKNGAFQQVEDLLKVPGIGPKTLEANKDVLVVE